MDEKAGAIDIRGALGLRSTATDAQVMSSLAELRQKALGNLAGPEGWTGIAMGEEAAVFESFVEAPLADVTLKPGAYEAFDGEVEMVQFTAEADGTRIVVRIRRSGE